MEAKGSHGAFDTVGVSRIVTVLQEGRPVPSAHVEGTAVDVVGQQ